MLTTTVCLKCGSTCETRCKAQTASKDFQEKRRALPRRRSRGRPSRRAPSASRRRQLLRYSRPRRRASGRPSSAPKGDQQNGYSEEFEHSKKKKYKGMLTLTFVRFINRPFSNTPSHFSSSNSATFSSGGTSWDREQALPIWTGHHCRIDCPS